MYFILYNIILMFVLLIFVVMLIAFIILSIKVITHNKENINNKENWEECKFKSYETCGDYKTPKAAFLVLWFFCFITLFVSVFFVSCIKSYNSVDFSLVRCIVLWIFVLLWIYCIVWTIRSIIRDRRIHYLSENKAFVVKKAEITRFEYFSYPETERRMGKKGYIIVAYVWSQKYKSKEIGDWAIWFERRNFDKKYYEKKWIPYWPKDPNFNEEFKKLAEAKLREIDLKIAELREEWERSSMFKKFRIAWKIDKLQIEKNRIYPLSMPYRWHNYYIWDEIDVYVDPDNPKIYIM